MLYPFDPSGTADSNRVVGEVHAVSPPETINDASLIVPRMTPFFKEGLIVRFGSGVLVEGVDYILVFHHLSLSAHLTRSVFGGISFRNREFTGTVKLTYQVVGGDFQLGDTEILEKLTRRLGHFQYVTYDQIVGTPSSFPPDLHLHDMGLDLVNMDDVVNILTKMSTDISKNPGSLGEVSTRLNNHMNQATAHTKGQVGLGNVENLATATLADVVSGKVKRFVTSDVLYLYVADYLAQANNNTGLASQVEKNKTDINSLFYNQSQSELQIAAVTKTANDALKKAEAALGATGGGLTSVDVVNIVNTALGDLDLASIASSIVTMQKTINEFGKRLDNLPTGGGGTGGGTGTVPGVLVAKVQIGITSKSTWWNSSNVVSTATIKDTEGLPMTLVSTSSNVYSSGTSFTVKLPSTYDPALHRVIVSGGGYTVNDSGKSVAVRVPATRSESYQYEVGDDNRTGTRYYCSASFTVELVTR